MVEPPSPLHGADLYTTSTSASQSTAQAANSIGQRVSSAFGGFRKNLSRTSSGLRSTVTSSPPPPGGRDTQRPILKEWESEGHRGHAHDRSQDEPLFLRIGTGPPPDVAEGEEHQEAVVAESAIVSESPGAAGFDIFDQAYHDELQRIHAEKGTEVVTYLTRRVQRRRMAQAGGAGSDADTAPRSKMSLLAAVERMKAGDAGEAKTAD